MTSLTFFLTALLSLSICSAKGIYSRPEHRPRSQCSRAPLQRLQSVTVIPSAVSDARFLRMLERFYIPGPDGLSPTPKCLILDNNLLGDSLAHSIATIIKQDPYIEKISLRNTSISPDGLKSIMESMLIGRNTHLKIIDMAENPKITLEGLIAIWDAENSPLKGIALKAFKKEAVPFIRYTPELETALLGYFQNKIINKPLSQ